VKSISQAINELTFKESLPDGLTLLCGSSGTGKTIFSQEFAFEFLEAGGRVLWITTEELPSNLKSGMSKFGWDTSKYESNGKFVVLDAVSPARLGLSENIGRGTLGLDPTGMLIVISEQLRQADPDSSQGKLLLVLDSISRLLLSCDPKSVIDFVSCTSSRMENYRVKGFATISEGAHDEKTLNALTFSCAGTVRFRIRDDGEARVRQLRLETIRGRRHIDTWKDYAITEKGLDVEV
jgi:KaiC/GvpD/RAD55 family RecA-like ATPase